MSLKKIAKNIIVTLPARIVCKLQTIRARGKLTLGKGAYVHRSVHILGKSNVIIGSNSCISEGCWLNVNHRIEKETSIQIGKNCFIGKDNFFTSGLKISIGDYVLTTIDCKFIGASHLIEDPLKPYISTGTTNHGVIEVGVNCFIGASAMVLGNVKIGHGSVIGAGAQVMHDIPPFSIAIGNPARVIKRFSFRKNRWVSVNEISLSDLKEMPNEEDYRALLYMKYQNIPMPMIAIGRDMGNL